MKLTVKRRTASELIDAILDLQQRGFKPTLINKEHDINKVYENTYLAVMIKQPTPKGGTTATNG